MSFPNEGKSFPGSPNEGSRRTGDTAAIGSTEFAGAMSAALNRAFEGHGSKIKIVAKLTGAHERTVKNWFRGSYGPSGAHLIRLARSSDVIFEAFVSLTGRAVPVGEGEVAALESRLIDLLISRQRDQN